jgi:hypothetical protein
MEEIKVNLVVISALLFILFIVYMVNATYWNHGHCSCGGKWIYQQAVGHRSDTTYVYKCDKCGKIKEFFFCYSEEK